MKKKPLISIEEQMYRAGIWERPWFKGYAKHDGIRIMSDGTGYGTQIIDGKTGAPIPNVYKAELYGEVGSLWEAVLYCHAIPEINGCKYRIKKTIFPKPRER